MTPSVRKKSIVSVALVAFVAGIGCSTTDDGANVDPGTGRAVAGSECSVDTECASSICRGEVCSVPAADDRIRNADETDVDCGGKDPKVPRCTPSQVCRDGADCTSQVCKGFACQEPGPTDGVKNGTETDVDCGGASKSPRCKAGLVCVASSDCESNLCKAGKCLSPAANDGVKNGSETDIDCGGTDAGTPRCKDGKACAEKADCESSVCPAAKKTCSPATATDDVKNGDESDVDCGGKLTNAPKCAVDKLCKANTDCASDGCGAGGRCAISRSCTGTFGATTCGAGEVGSAGTAHESCCAPARKLASGATPDKYQITAGRMRAFVERVGGNVVGWLRGARPSLPPATQATVPNWMDTLLPAGFDGTYGVWNQLGSSVYLTNRPSSLQGCFINGYGTHTYWMSQGVQSSYFGDGVHGYPQDVLDTKALNCVTEPMLAAFCAWDGGRLESAAEQAEMYGPALYPWGSSPEAAGFGPAGGVYQKVSGRPGASGTACPGCEPMTNWLNIYQYPAPSAARPTDYSFFIAAPGRFPRDVGPYGTADTAGNLIEATSTFDGTDPEYGQPKVVWSRNGSWEGHPIGGSPSYKFALTTKYGKLGGRCVR